jgi:hypothetical protein
MSISITIRETAHTIKYELTNDTINIDNIIDNIQQYTKHGSELTIFLYDPDTTTFHNYVFDYLATSANNPRHWLLNNILYAITCKDSNNFIKLVIPVYNKLAEEYNKINK